MQYHKVELCGVNTAKLPVLKEKEKAALLRAVKNGDEEARQKMINGNLRLVLSVVQKFSGRGENLDDLFQVGCIGLIKAVDNFNPDVSRSMRDVAYKAMQAREQLQKELGRDPTPEQIARRIELPKRTVTLALESVVEPISLYEPVYNDGGDTICVLDQLGESGSEENWISAMSLRDTMNSLSPREKKIMALRYLSGKTQVEVAQEIGISQAQVSRLEKNALARIKSEL